MTLKELLVKVGFYVDKQEAQEAFSELNGVLELFRLAAQAATPVFEQFLLKAVQSGAQVSQSTQQLGLGAQALQQLSVAAERSGLSTDTFARALEHLGGRAGEVWDGSTAAAQALAQLGVKAFDAHGQLRGTEELLGDFADKLSKLPEGLEKAALVQQVFGRSSAELIQLLDQGRAGLDALRDGAHTLGRELGEGPVQASAQASEALRSFGLAAQGLRGQLGKGLSDDVLQLADAFTSWLDVGRSRVLNDLPTALKALQELLATGVLRELHTELQAPHTGGEPWLLLQVRKLLQALRELKATSGDLVGFGLYEKAAEVSGGEGRGLRRSQASEREQPAGQDWLGAFLGDRRSPMSTGSSEAPAVPGSSAPGYAPAPSIRIPSAGSVQLNQQNTATITVNAAPGQSPQEIAGATFDRFADQMPELLRREAPGLGVS